MYPSHTTIALPPLRFLICTVAVLIVVCCNLPAMAQTCGEPSSGVHRFRRQGESFEIPINDADCQADLLELRWSNGRNNGTNFLLVFLDSDDQTIFMKEVWGFLNGYLDFPFAAEASFGGPAMMSVPAKVRIQAVAPFAPPAMISYRVVRKAGRITQNSVVAAYDKEQIVLKANGKN